MGDGMKLDARTLAELRERAANLHPEESHAANDLALYTVNTAAIYFESIRPTIEHQRKRISKGQPVTLPPWVLIARKGRESYTKELRADPFKAVKGFRWPIVEEAAAVLIRDHFEEELTA